jgi:hypothetical protein
MIAQIARIHWCTTQLFTFYSQGVLIQGAIEQRLTCELKLLAQMTAVGVVHLQRTDGLTCVRCPDGA